MPATKYKNMGAAAQMIYNLVIPLFCNNNKVLFFNGADDDF